MAEWKIHLIERHDEMEQVEALQRITWPGSETDVIPGHLILAVIHNGGLALGAYVDAPHAESPRLVGLVFGFPGIYETPDGPRVKHHSHILAVHPDWQGKGVGFALKRAQWQMVRRHGIDRVTWTYDPLLSRNAYLNIARLGAVCSTYQRSVYGDMRDGLNAGLPSDRFQVDWWVNSKRVLHRLSRQARPPLALDHFLATPALILEAGKGKQFPLPPGQVPQLSGSLVIIEIPDDFGALKGFDLGLARDWRFYAREAFETAFSFGYIVTDLVHGQGRSFYVLTHGESTF